MGSSLARSANLLQVGQFERSLARGCWQKYRSARPSLSVAPRLAVAAEPAGQKGLRRKRRSERERDGSAIGSPIFKVATCKNFRVSARSSCAAPPSAAGLLFARQRGARRSRERRVQNWPPHKPSAPKALQSQVQRTLRTYPALSKRANLLIEFIGV